MFTNENAKNKQYHKNKQHHAITRTHKTQKKKLYPAHARINKEMCTQYIISFFYMTATIYKKKIINIEKKRSHLVPVWFCPPFGKRCATLATLVRVLIPPNRRPCHDVLATNDDHLC